MRSFGASSQAILLAAGSALGQVVVAVTYLFAARSSDPYQYGLAVTAISLGGVFVGLFDFGANALWVREIAREKMSLESAMSRAATKLLAALVVAVLVVVIVLLIAPTSLLWVAGIVGVLMTASQLSQVPLRAAAMSERVAVGLVVGRLAALAVMAALLFAGVPSIHAFWIAIASGSLFECVLNLAIAPRHVRYRSGRLHFANPWAGSLHYGTYGVAISAQNLDVAMIAGLAGPSAAGLYGAVNRWTQPLGIAVSAFTSASVPFIARSHSWRESFDHIRRSLWMPATALVACAVAAMLAPQIVPFLLGDQYEGAVAVLQIMALGTIPAIANQPIAAFLQARMRDRAVARCTVAAVAARLAAVALAAPAFGALGAAIAYALSQVALLTALAIVLVLAVRGTSEGR